MPNINIVDKDYTTPGISNSANFTVLVPGFVSSSKWAEKAEDDIIELSTQSDFIKYVGKVPAMIGTVRVFAKAEPFSWPSEDDQPEQTIPGYSTPITAEDFYYTYRDQIYSFRLLETPPENNKGKNYLKVVASESASGITYNYYFLTKLTAYPGEPEPGVAAPQYVIVLSGNEGTDAEGNAEYHYGNQIAYELLGLGFPILYKRIPEGVNELTDYEKFWSVFEDKSNYTFRFIINGLCNGDYLALVNNLISQLATKRGDCIALVDINETRYLGKTTTADIIRAIGNGAASDDASADKNTAFFVPTLCYKAVSDSIGYNGNTKFPAGFHYLACFANMLSNNYAEWYAAAGLSRGVSKFAVESTEVKLGEVAEKALEPRFASKDVTVAVNVIEKIRSRYYLYGNRTAHKLGTEGAEDGDLIASHFLNIRQLCCTLKQELYQICKRLTFNPNSDLLWINFCNAITPTLETMKGNQGIEDYEIIQVAVNKKALLKARIRIVPIEAVEDFDIEIALEDSLGETSVTVSE